MGQNNSHEEVKVRRPQSIDELLQQIRHANKILSEKFFLNDYNLSFGLQNEQYLLSLDKFKMSRKSGEISIIVLKTFRNTENETKFSESLRRFDLDSFLEVYKKILLESIINMKMMRKKKSVSFGRKDDEYDEEHEIVIIGAEKNPKKDDDDEEENKNKNKTKIKKIEDEDEDDPNSEVPDSPFVDCPICLDKKVEVTLDCSHSFCEACVLLWREQKYENTCPICREFNLDQMETTAYNYVKPPDQEEVVKNLYQFILSFNTFSNQEKKKKGGICSGIN